MSTPNVWQIPDEKALPYLLQNLQTRMLALETKALRVPVLNEDPEPGDPTNVWLFADGRLRMKMPNNTIREYRPYDSPNIPTLSADPPAGSQTTVWLTTGGELRVRAANGTVQRFAPVTATTSTTSTTSSTTTTETKPQTTELKTYEDTFYANWGQSYKGNGSQRTDTNHLYYGYQNTFNGFQKSQIGFDDAAIRAALAGATIKKVEIYLQNLWAGYNAGVEIYFGGHNNDNKPAGYTGVVRTEVSKAHFGKPGYPNSGPTSQFVPVSNWFGEEFKADRIKGLVLHPPGTSLTYYGYAAGYSDGGYAPPAIRFTYVK